MKYYLKPGDALYQEKTSAYGILLKKTGSKWTYWLRSPSCDDRNIILVNKYDESVKTIYNAIDTGNIKVFYGSKKNRRRRET